MNDPKQDPKWEAEWDQLLEEEKEMFDVLSTVSIADIVDAEEDGKLVIGRHSANTVEVKEEDFAITDNEDPIFNNLKEQFE